MTARFRKELLQETPLAITAMSAESIAARGFTSASEVAQTVPNARFAQAQAAYGKSMTAYIRGVGQYDFNPAFEPGVGVYVDDTYYAALTGSLFDLLDLERVEVLRGPQGTLFGRGAIGGAMRLVTRQPTGDGTGYVTASGWLFRSSRRPGRLRHPLSSMPASSCACRVPPSAARVT